MLSDGVEEYLFTIGILIAFVGLLVSIVRSRKDIVDVFRSTHISRKHVAAALVIVALFLATELYFVQATQQLFFDDAIYQAMALDLLHTGQAWMCDYGTTTACFIGEIFHEPIGTSFNLAAGFAIFGVSRATTYGVDLFMSAASVLLTFLAALLLFKNAVAALFSELLLALSPMLLVWAAPTTSDVPMLAYFLLAVICMLIFKERKNVRTFALLAFSVAMASYMKVDALGFMVVVVLMYLILDGKSARDSLRQNWLRVKRAVSETQVLVVLLLFFVSVAPMIIYAYNEVATGYYGAQGSIVPNTCGSGVLTAKSNFGLDNFAANFCANLFFWFNTYQGSYIMQPIAFTVLALIGAGFMVLVKRREGLALGLWFLSFFALYTAFYAGAVTFGVDWRFMISAIAQASIFGGFGCAMLISAFGEGTKRIKSKIGKLKSTEVVFAAALLVVIAYSIYMLIPQLSVSPSNIPQAGDARFYENFVYNESHLIPSSCVVFTYDPTLFNINNRSALQLSYIYDQQQYQQASSQFGCMYVDYGYWCYTPNNLCANLNSSFVLSPIASATYQPGKTYYLYRIVSQKQ